MTDTHRDLDADVDDPGSGHGLDSAADDGLDLTPRTGPSPARPRSMRRGRRTNPFAWVVLGLLVVGAGFVVLQGLGNATLYFRNVDEAIAERDSLGARDFRVQGLVTTPADTVGDVVEFTITFNDVDLPVRSTAGPPPDLFGLGVPVVLEGHFGDGVEPVFEAHRILVKHDETYEADNGARLRDAEDGETGTGSGTPAP